MSDSYESSIYFQKIINLIIDTGTETLRNLFYSEVPKTYVATVFSSDEIKRQFSTLQTKHTLTKAQYEQLTVHPDPDTYDITLLVLLLQTKKVCANIKKPVNGWSQQPPDTDLTVGADLVRLREIRNKIVGHQPKAQLQKDEFEFLWKEVSDILIRIAGRVGCGEQASIKGKISQAEKRVWLPIEDREKKLLEVFQDWYKHDHETLQQQMTNVDSSLKNLHLKVDSHTDSHIETRSQLELLMENLRNVAQQRTSEEIKSKIEELTSLIQEIPQSVISLVQGAGRAGFGCESSDKCLNRSDPPLQAFVKTSGNYVDSHTDSQIETLFQLIHLMQNLRNVAQQSTSEEIKSKIEEMTSRMQEIQQSVISLQGAGKADCSENADLVAKTADDTKSAREDIKQKHEILQPGTMIEKEFQERCNLLGFGCESSDKRLNRSDPHLQAFVKTCGNYINQLKAENDDLKMRLLHSTDGGEMRTQINQLKAENNDLKMRLLHSTDGGEMRTQINQLKAENDDLKMMLLHSTNGGEMRTQRNLLVIDRLNKQQFDAWTRRSKVNVVGFGAPFFGLGGLIVAFAFPIGVTLLILLCASEE